MWPCGFYVLFMLPHSCIFVDFVLLRKGELVGFISFSLCNVCHDLFAFLLVVIEGYIM